ncbi:hypothetical protein V6N12_069441 [Hibiscus sabdariffa]|uniref:Uncharacterized protein n=1 Tax=Hibiscus sabdariffa TaxID=183260 RepID=A0ABR2FDX7_9ROSI
MYLMFGNFSPILLNHIDGWNAMFTYLVKIRDFVECFFCMPEMISACINSEKPRDRCAAGSPGIGVQGDEVIVVVVLSACADLGALLG